MLPIILGCIGLILFGTMNNVGGSMMSYVMPGFPAWLLYGTTIIYTLGFWLMAIIKDNPFEKRHLEWNNQKYYLILSVLTALNGLLFQFAAAWVDGPLSQVLANLLIVQLPFFELLCIGKERMRSFRTRDWIGLVIVFIGIIIGIIPLVIKYINDHNINVSEQSDKWWWILIFILSTSFQALEQIYQDIAFHDKNAKVTELSCLAWYNLYSLPLYLLVIPLESVAIINGTNQSTTVLESFTNQYGAFCCFVNHPLESDIINGNCKPGSTLWPIIFSIGYIGMFSINAYLIDKYGVLYPNIIGSSIEFVAALTFMLPFIVGSYASNFTFWPLLGCLIVVLGVIIKGPPKELNNKKDYEPVLEINYA
jgi:hypothetical protein